MESGSTSAGAQQSQQSLPSSNARATINPTDIELSAFGPAAPPLSQSLSSASRSARRSSQATEDGRAPNAAEIDQAFGSLGAEEQLALARSAMSALIMSRRGTAADASVGALHADGMSSVRGLSSGLSYHAVYVCLNCHVFIPRPRSFRASL